MQCHGKAACRFHKMQTGEGMVLNSDTVRMAPQQNGVSPTEALERALQWFLAVISVDPELPIHESSMFGLSVAPLLHHRYSVGAKRSLNLQYSAVEENAMAKVMLLRLSQLATCQQLVDEHNGQEVPETRFFLIGRPTKNAKTKTYILQFDLVQRMREGVLIAPFFAQKLIIVKNQTTGIVAFSARSTPHPDSIEHLVTCMTVSEATAAMITS